MDSKARILGHSVHPIMIVFPLGLLATAVVFDVMHMIWGNAVFATVSYWMIVSGIIGALIAAPFGLVDWISIPSGTRAKSIGLTHGIVNLVVVGLFAVSWYLREIPERPPTSASALAIIGFVLALVGGWLGGELVERLGVSVHPGANLDAPSSLSADTVQMPKPHPHKS